MIEDLPEESPVDENPNSSEDAPVLGSNENTWGPPLDENEPDIKDETSIEDVDSESPPILGQNEKTWGPSLNDEAA